MTILSTSLKYIMPPCHNDNLNVFSSSSLVTRELDIANESSKDTGLALKRMFSGLFGNTMLMIHALASHYVFFPDFFARMQVFSEPMTTT